MTLNIFSRNTVFICCDLLRCSNRNDTATGGTTAAPATGGNGSVAVGRADAPVTVVAYEDFQCPACKSFEDANAAQLARWVDDGTVRDARGLTSMTYNSPS